MQRAAHMGSCRSPNLTSVQSGQRRQTLSEASVSERGICILRRKFPSGKGVQRNRLFEKEIMSKIEK